MEKRKGKAPQRPVFSPEELLWYRQVPGFSREIWWKPEEGNLAAIAWELLRRHPDWHSFFTEFPPEKVPDYSKAKTWLARVVSAAKLGRREVRTALPAAICVQGGEIWPNVHSGLRTFFEHAIPLFLRSALVDEDFAFRLNDEKALINIEEKWIEELAPPCDFWLSLVTGEVKPNVALFVNTDTAGPAPGLLDLDDVERLRQDFLIKLKSRGWQLFTIGINPDATGVPEVLTAFEELLENRWKPKDARTHKTHRRKLNAIAEFDNAEYPDDDLRKRLRGLYRGVTFQPFINAFKTSKCWASTIE